MDKPELEELREYRRHLADEIGNYNREAIEWSKRGDILCAMATGSYAGLLKKQLKLFDSLFPELK